MTAPRPAIRRREHESDLLHRRRHPPERGGKFDRRRDLPYGDRRRAAV